MEPRDVDHPPDHSDHSRDRRVAQMALQLRVELLPLGRHRLIALILTILLLTGRI
jgi:hypothetical protein